MGLKPSQGENSTEQLAKPIQLPAVGIFQKIFFGNPWEIPKDHRPPDFFGFLSYEFSKLKSMFQKTHQDHSLPSEKELDEHFPVLKPDQEILNHPKKDATQVTWIGHSTFFVQIGGYNFLTDPIFSIRSSPFQFIGPKRYRNVPIELEDLPKVDFVLVSHNHFDHLDVNVVKKLGNSVRWFVPLGLKDWFAKYGINNVQEMNWWEERSFSKDCQIIATPAQHWSKRHIFRRNESLWCSFLVVHDPFSPGDKKEHAHLITGSTEESRELVQKATVWNPLSWWAMKTDTSQGNERHFSNSRKMLFFCGDTSYCPAFKQIYQRYGPVDLSFIPIGSYAPAKVQRLSHIDPAEAVQVHLDLKSRLSIAMHFGTFHLTSEHVFEPPQFLRKCLVERNIPLERFLVMKHGETKIF